MGPKIINLLPHRVVLPAVFRVVYIMVHSQARHEDGTATISCKEIHEKLAPTSSWLILIGSFLDKILLADFYQKFPNFLEVKIDVIQVNLTPYQDHWVL